MKLTTRVEYGLRAMVELAKKNDHQPVSLRELAQNQEISLKYLEQMAAALKIAGLIESVRGAEGGYRLTKSPEKITAWDVYKVLDDPNLSTDCLLNRCSRSATCSSRQVWSDMNQAITNTLKSYTLQKMAKQEIALQRKA